MNGLSLDALHLLFLATAGALALILGWTLRARRVLRRTLEELPVGLCTVDSDLAVTQWNREMAAISGIPASEACGRHLKTLTAPWARTLDEALSAGDEVIKRRLTDGSNTTRWVIAHASAARSERAVLIEDISNYQRLQDELLHKERLASIGRLAAGVAHEIGNPVTGIACLAQNLAVTDDSEEVRQGADEILRQSQRISDIVSSLLQFSHSGGSAKRIACSPCNIADCVDEAIHLLGLDRASAGDRFLNRCDRELLVLADNQLLLQVFINLLDNARTASPEGSDVEIDARREDASVCITVDNSGPALPETVLAQAFEPFFTTKDVGAGTGLGLPLVRGMIEDMDGEISLLSPRPGAGGGVRAMLQLPHATYDAS